MWNRLRNSLEPECEYIIVAAEKMGNVDPLTITVKDQGAYQQIVSAIYQDAMGLVMIVVACLMVLGIILTLSLKDIKKQKGAENEQLQ